MRFNFFPVISDKKVFSHKTFILNFVFMRNGTSWNWFVKKFTKGFPSIFDIPNQESMSWNYFLNVQCLKEHWIISVSLQKSIRKNKCNYIKNLLIRSEKILVVLIFIFITKLNKLTDKFFILITLTTSWFVTNVRTRNFDFETKTLNKKHN